MLVTRPRVTPGFSRFLTKLQKDLGPDVSGSSTVRVLTRRLVAGPIFSTLFSGCDFLRDGPMSHVVRGVLSILRSGTLRGRRRALSGFCTDIRRHTGNVSGTRNGRGVVVRLCRRFFGGTLPGRARQLNVICAPIRIMSFVVRSIRCMVRRQFNHDVDSGNIRILSPFAKAKAFVIHLLHDNVVGPRSLLCGCADRVRYGRVILLTCCVTTIGVRRACRRLDRDRGCIPFRNVILASAFRLTRHSNAHRNRTSADVFRLGASHTTGRVRAPVRMVVNGPPCSIKRESNGSGGRGMTCPRLRGTVTGACTMGSGTMLGHGACRDDMVTFE